MAFWVYMLRCSDGSLYAGHSDDLDTRVAQHHAGAMPDCYTFARRPLTLAYAQPFESRDEALAAERRIKGWRRARKEALIDGRFDLLPGLAYTAQRASAGAARTEIGAHRASTNAARAELAACGGAHSNSKHTAAAPDDSGADDRDRDWMQRALALAERAEREHDEVPVGALLVSADGELLGEGWNRNIADHDPSAHAEIVALRAAGRRLGNHRLLGTTLYVTLEPCAMCAMAIVHARVARLVYAAADPKTGACGSVFDLIDDPRHNHRVEVVRGVLAQAAGERLRAYFRCKRAAPRARRGSSP